MSSLDVAILSEDGLPCEIIEMLPKRLTKYVRVEANQPLVFRVHIAADYTWHNATHLELQLYLNSIKSLPSVLVSRPNETNAVAEEVHWLMIWEPQVGRWSKVTFAF